MQDSNVTCNSRRCKQYNANAVGDLRKKKALRMLRVMHAEHSQRSEFCQFFHEYKMNTRYNGRRHVDYSFYRSVIIAS